MQSVMVRLPKPLYERLRNEAHETRVSQAEIVRQELEDRYKRADAAEAETCCALRCPLDLGVLTSRGG